jgi:hypothetical protein
VLAAVNFRADPLAIDEHDRASALAEIENLLPNLRLIAEPRDNIALHDVERPASMVMIEQRHRARYFERAIAAVNMMLRVH